MPEGYDKEMFQLLVARIQAMPDGEEKEQMMSDLYRDYPIEMAVAQEELESGIANLSTAMPEGREAGGVYTAANPLEHLTAALRQGYGGLQRRRGMESMAEMADARTRGRSEMAEALMAGDVRDSELVDSEVGQTQGPVGPRGPVTKTSVQQATGNTQQQSSPVSEALPDSALIDSQQISNTSIPTTPKDNFVSQRMPSLGYVDRAMQGSNITASPQIPSFGLGTSAMMGSNIGDPRFPQKSEMNQPGAGPQIPPRELSSRLRQRAMDEEEERRRRMMGF